jgi:hypothetical protein
MRLCNILPKFKTENIEIVLNYKPVETENRMKWHTAIWFTIISAFSAVMPAEAEGDRGEYAGYVIQLQGSGSVSNTLSHHTTRLMPATAPFFNLFESDQIRCAPNSVLTLQLRYGGETNLHWTQWLPVPLEADPLLADNQRKRAAQYVEKSLRSSGRQRGKGVPIVFQPASGSCVHRDVPFLVRWTPATNAPELNIKITYVPSALIWSTNYPAAAGQANAKDFLDLAMAARVPEEAEFVLECGLSGQPSKSLTFKFLENEVEKDLQARLLDAAKAFPEKGAAYHLVCAGIFDDYKLYNEAAEECDAALKFASQSLELLRRVKEAHEKIGDVLEENRIGRLLEQAQNPS